VFILLEMSVTRAISGSKIGENAYFYFVAFVVRNVLDVGVIGQHSVYCLGHSKNVYDDDDDDDARVKVKVRYT